MKYSNEIARKELEIASYEVALAVKLLDNVTALYKADFPESPKDMDPEKEKLYWNTIGEMLDIKEHRDNLVVLGSKLKDLLGGFSMKLV